jgi:hypothetical protein
MGEGLGVRAFWLGARLTVKAFARLEKKRPPAPRVAGARGRVEEMTNRV